MSATSIVLVDDHQLVRQGLRALLEAEPDFSIIGEAANGLEAAESVQRLGPDILIVDLKMPSLSGLEVTRQVSQRWPQTRVVILSMYSDEGYVLEALRNGASAYVLKQSSADDLVRAVRQAVVGRHYLSPPLSERVIDVYREKVKNAASDPYDTLTHREREVLHLAAEGNSNAETAARLSISPRTAEVHRVNMRRKLGLRNQTELVVYAIRRGFIPVDEPYSSRRF